MTNRKTNLLAALMLVIMLSLSFFAMLGDSQTMDEVSHLPAGYSYITQKDMRINPEHPPLIKDLSGLSIWLWSKISNTHINFPSDIKAWKSDVNGQWDFGFNFMYKSGNDADKMLFFGRLPMLLILLLLGFYIFKWAKELAGNKAALLALFFYSFSPAFIAHGHLVTTDVAAAAAIFISLYYFIRWLKSPSSKNLIIAGLVFGFALSAKFSTFLLIPLFLFISALWLFIQKNYKFLSALRVYIGGLILIGVIGLIIIYPIYLYHTWNYPITRQTDDMRVVLNSYASGPDQAPLASCKTISKIGRCPAELTILMAQKPVLRPWAQYFYGLLMVVQRTSGGNTTFFMGEISNSGWKTYFPIVYAIKEPLALHMLTLIALFYSLYLIFISGVKNIFSRLINWIKTNIAELSMLSFIALYWASSINSPLNIGVRHVLPTFPLIYLLTSRQINKWLTIFSPNNLDGFIKKLNFFGRTLVSYSIKYSIISLLLLWQFFSVVFATPYFLSYFNEIIGGSANGYKYAVDSNLDWGQDFKRLVNWTNQNNIKTLYVDYFGGTVGEYYLDGRLIPWSGEKDWKQLPPESYLAISATFRQSCFGQPVPGFQYPACYQWLKNYEPIIVIGNSIFVYYIQ
jgi:4-amino-4-deoxy-L-arabinose transferase-like glycosyltransferase